VERVTSEKVIVIKQNIQEMEVWRYEGTVLNRRVNAALIEARFNRTDLFFHGITLRENDRFVEAYYAEEWFNIFEIHDKDDDRVKGWYCNVCRPARFEDGKIYYVDLALDLLVYPDGRKLELDEDEFTALKLNPTEIRSARSALQKLASLFNHPHLLNLTNDW